MSDDISIGGRVVALDEVTLEGATKLVARDKIGFGDPGTYADVSATNPLPVTNVTEASAIGATGDAASASTVIGRLKAIANSLATTASSFLAVRLTDGSAYLNSTAGRLQVADGGVALAVSAAALPLPTGAATAASQATIASALAGTLTVAPTVDGDLAGTLTDGRKTVTTPGTAVAVRGSLACKWVLVTALKTNTDQVNVGGAGTLAAAGSSTGSPLAAGESVTLPVSNANLVFVDARVAGEGVSFTVGGA